MIITAGIYKGRKMSVPDEKITRPTLSKVRMGVFNTLYSLIGEFEDKYFLDVFGGSGVMGLEALSRGFKCVKVIEKNFHAVKIIKKNYESLGLIPELQVGDSLKILKQNCSKYDVVYIDPPYQSEIYDSVVEIAENIGKVIVVEHSNELSYSGTRTIKTKDYGGKKVSFLY